MKIIPNNKEFQEYKWNKNKNLFDAFYGEIIFIFIAIIIVKKEAYIKQQSMLCDESKIRCCCCCYLYIIHRYCMIIFVILMLYDSVCDAYTQLSQVEKLSSWKNIPNTNKKNIIFFLVIFLLLWFRCVETKFGCDCNQSHLNKHKYDRKHKNKIWNNLLSDEKKNYFNTTICTSMNWNCKKFAASKWNNIIKKINSIWWMQLEVLLR